ncbi:MAG: polyphenol oxidase family protein [Phycisphaerae bacterium]|nr:polyphenol oxidase family protein [Phycisphaerae bacterium]
MSELRRVVAPNGVVVFQSSILSEAGFGHGFSTRVGVGNSNFDLALPTPQVQVGQDVYALRLRQLLDACGLGGRIAICARQVHGAAALDGDRTEPMDSRQSSPLPEADAIVSSDARRAVAIRTADCVGVLLASPDTGTVAAVHAGWRGIVAGVVERAVEAVRARSSGPMLAAIGPSVSCSRYEVGEEVATAFVGAGLEEHVVRTGHLRVDCHGAVRSLLRRAGLVDVNIDGEPLCTVSDPIHFFSHRRDGTASGRLLALIGASAVAQ